MLAPTSTVAPTTEPDPTPPRLRYSLNLLRKIINFFNQLRDCSYYVRSTLPKRTFSRFKGSGFRSSICIFPASRSSTKLAKLSTSDSTRFRSATVMSRWIILIWSRSLSVGYRKFNLKSLFCNFLNSLLMFCIPSPIPSTLTHDLLLVIAVNKRFLNVARLPPRESQSWALIM